MCKGWEVVWRSVAFQNRSMRLLFFEIAQEVAQKTCFRTWIRSFRRRGAYYHAEEHPQEQYLDLVRMGVHPYVWGPKFGKYPPILQPILTWLQRFAWTTLRSSFDSSDQIVSYIMRPPARDVCDNQDDEKAWLNDGLFWLQADVKPDKMKKMKG